MLIWHCITGNRGSLAALHRKVIASLQYRWLSGAVQTGQPLVQIGAEMSYVQTKPGGPVLGVSFAQPGKQSWLSKYSMLQKSE